MAIDTVNPRSRRVLLAATAGSLAALAASALGRPLPARAADPNDVVLGATNTATTTTTISNTTTTSTAFWGFSSSGIGVRGSSSSYYGVRGQSTSSVGVVGGSSSSSGVYGSSDSGTGVSGYSGSNVGVIGGSYATDKPGTVGQSSGNSTGLLGYSGTGVLPAAPARTGVYGYAAQDASSRGVWGRANAGRGVYGQATNGYGVYGTASAGTAAYFKGGDGTGKALNAQGRVFFKTAGLATIGAGASSTGPIAAGVDLVASSKILATLEGNPGAGVTIHRVTKSTAADTLTVHLTGPAATACKVAWFVIG